MVRPWEPWEPWFGGADAPDAQAASHHARAAGWGAGLRGPDGGLVGHGGPKRYLQAFRNESNPA